MKFTWSHSALSTFESCPKKYYHLYVAKDVKDEFDKKEANEGIANHKAFENRLLKGTQLPLDLRHHEPILKRLSDVPGDGYPEQKLAINRNFEPTGFFDNDVYGRAVIDFMKVRDDKCVIIDHKFGKKHNDPAQLLMFIGFVGVAMPEINEFSAAFYWAKDKSFTKITATREGMPEVWNSVIPRVNKLEQAIKLTEFPAQQSGLCKKHCPVLSCPHNGRGKV